MCGIARFLGEFVPGLVYFPFHPWTREHMESIGLYKELENSQVHLLPPLPYKSFLRLYKDAKLVMTDSGGIQEETTILGIPCLTIRLKESFRILNGNCKKGKIPKLWDGKASERIVNILLGRPYEPFKPEWR